MKLLFICTHNRCRSILCEAITNHLAKGKITAYSAGSQPVGEVHPLSIKYLRSQGISTEGLQSQSWDDFEQVDPDVVITVCDSAANEVCPVWFGDCTRVHWGLPDPSINVGSEEEVQAAFYSLMDSIQNRIEQTLTLDLNNKNELKTTLDNIAKGDEKDGII